ncbi:MAG: nucleotidyltransferase family protein [Chloroflexi bacterium]|nr:nucleotidyltransferase family protein [Chloroflexota bacterium]
MLKDLVEIGQIIQNGIVFNPRNWEKKRMESASLLQVVNRLFTLLNKRGIDYVLVGGVALLNYVEGRNTQDIDLIMALPDLAKVPEIKVEEQDNPYFARGEFEGLQIDILLTTNPLFQLVRQKYTEKLSFLEQEITIATVEGLLLLKLYALPSLYRQGNFVRVSVYENDIAALMYVYQPDMEMIMKILERYVGEGDLRSIREIVAEIRQRIQRFQNGLET